eukprot:78376-Chlamydomonas_euryale.AAC.6
MHMCRHAAALLRLSCCNVHHGARQLRIQEPCNCVSLILPDALVRASVGTPDLLIWSGPAQAAQAMQGKRPATCPPHADMTRCGRHFCSKGDHAWATGCKAPGNKLKFAQDAACQADYDPAALR